MKRKSSFVFYALLFVLVVGTGMILLNGCGKKAYQPVQPPEEVLTLYSLVVTPSSIVEGDSCLLAALVTDEKGDPREGIGVTFQVAPDTLGYFSNSIDTTDVYGIASTYFYSLHPGTATFEATSQKAGFKYTQVHIRETTVQVNLIQIDISPLTLIADGISTSEITVIVRDSSGNFVDDGTIVKFTAGEKFADIDGDGYYTDFIDSLIYDTNDNGKWDAIGLISPAENTVSGIATATYVAGVQATAVYIKATVSGISTPVQDEKSIQLTPNTTVASITMDADSLLIQVRGTGGLESVDLVATAYDDNGNRVPGGIPIDFFITDGPDGGENLNGMGYGPITVITNSLGEAQVTLNSGTISGTVKTRASSGSIISQVTQVTVQAGPPEYICLGANPLNIRGWDVVNATSGIVAMVNDVYGNPVPDRTAVYFSTEEGMVDAYSETIGGLAETVYHSGDPRYDGIAHIYGSTSGGTVADTMCIIVSGPPVYVEILNYPSSLMADGASKGDVLVQVLDINRNYVVGGTEVEMDVTFGKIESGKTRDGVNGSVCESELQSQTLYQDYSPSSPDDGIGAVVTLEAKSGWAGAYVSIPFLTGPAYSKNCQIDMPSSVPYASQVPIEVLIRDRYNNPLAGHQLSASVFGSSIYGAAQVTDAYGIADGFSFIATADTLIKTAIVTVDDSDPRGGFTLSKKVSLSQEE
jgi:hypothetical protein